MIDNNLITIPAGQGKAARVKRGQKVKVINSHGQQVLDTWAFNADDLKEFMSMEHSRTFMERIIPQVGDKLVTNNRGPILTLAEDTSPGVHDTLLAARDRFRYELLNAKGYHDNCTDNPVSAMKELCLTPPEIPSPLNLYMNIPVPDGRNLTFEAPVSKPGDYVLLDAEMDCIVAFSARPQDIIPINGVDLEPNEAHFTIIE